MQMFSWRPYQEYEDNRSRMRERICYNEKETCAGGGMGFNESGSFGWRVTTEREAAAACSQGYVLPGVPLSPEMSTSR